MRKATIEPYASKLIWQEISPAPFESGWSIFIKLIGLNVISPREIAQLICRTDYKKYRESSLRYREGEWIDFDRFGQLLNVDSDRLRVGFLDTLNFTVTGYIYTKGEKTCNTCLSKGYHNVFFELGFIDICPWHREKLNSCRYCLTTVYSRGLKPKEDPFSKSDSKWLEWSSECKHIQIYDKQISSTNLLDDDELIKVKNSSLQFCVWWNKVKSQPEIFQFLSKTNYSDNEIEFLDFFLNAAEEIAGPCPWPLCHKRYPIRTLNWHENDQSCEDYDINNSSASISSLWGENYRSVRKHLYRRYIRHHKPCWNLLTNTHANDLSHIDCDTACFACIAFATWRLLNENLLVLEGFKNPKIRTFYIKIFELPEENFVQSNRAHLNLLYAQFFLIWHLIITKSSISKVAINFGDRFLKYYIPYITFNSNCTVLIPSPDYLLMKSIEHCADREKNHQTMFYSNNSEDWFETLNYQYVNYNKIIFKMYKFLARGRFYYLNL
ncbi:hypothetical protein GALL_193940 [mine drainage metagenome]|uniref:Uncharacterized protein n=1 Tax=mine drainage metagenome TaxID=410659 RepID=A0A1J5RS96_9ZZZZ